MRLIRHLESLGTLIPDFPAGQWLTDPLSVAAARGAARSELFRAHHCSHFASQNSPVGSVDTADRTPRERQARVHSPKGRRLRSRPCPMRGEAEGSDAGVAQEAARRRATRRVSLAAHVSVRGMAEAGRLTVGGRVARLRAYGLGDTRGASGASPKSLPRFRRRPDMNLSQRLLGI